MEQETPVLYACSFDGKGGGVVLAEDKVAAMLCGKDLAWAHVNAYHPFVRKWLESELSYLDQIIIDALLAEETRPRIVEFGEGAVVILRGVNLNKGADPEDMLSIRLWVDPYRIISIQRRPLKAVEDIQTKLADGRGPKNSGEFLSMLISCLSTRMEPVLSDLDERMDAIEEEVMERPDIEERHEIIDIRREAIILRRYIMPQRDVISYLRNSDIGWLDAMHKRRMQENLDSVIRHVEDLDTIRERAQIVKDELTNALSDAMNRNIFMLSIIAAVFLPLSFLTGLLGINVGGIPGASAPHAFVIVCGILVAVVFLQLFLFRKLKWF